MPINLSAPSSPEPDDAAAREQGLPTTEDAKTMDADSPEAAAGEQPQRKRRSKKQMIADAVVPAEGDLVEIKDLGTGAKIERPWTEAVALVKAEKAEFSDRAHHYAMLKVAQQAAAPAFAPPSQTPMDAPDAVATDGQTQPPATDAFGRPSPEQLEAARLPTDESGQMIAPEGSEHGDEVRVGAKTYHVGPTGTLVDGVVDAPAKRRWQRELGAGANGPWESVVVGSSQNGNGEPAFALPAESAPAELDIQTEHLPRTVESVEGGDDGVLKWKIGNGILEKIGMPNYSSFQIGPISISRMVVDDGRRTVVPLRDGREGEVPTAVIEAFETIDNTVEFIAARFRGQLMSFFQASGAIQQPVS